MKTAIGGISPPLKNTIKIPLRKSHNAPEKRQQERWDQFWDSFRYKAGKKQASHKQYGYYEKVKLPVCTAPDLFISNFL